ncbi:MAG: sulfotransferase [Phycisphaerales bacterium]|nr:sulfotransferase [Phycisphaerales bacterium]
MDLLIHVGLHRTGTTWMQKAVLPDPRVPLVDVWPDRPDIGRRLIMPADDELNLEDLRGELTKRIEGADPGDDCAAISHERFSGNPHSGAYDMHQTACRLHAVAPDARIFIAVREQQSMVESLWSQGVRTGLSYSISDYLRPMDAEDFRIPRFESRYLLYHRIVQAYIDRFGRDRVLVMDFEGLRHDPMAYMERLCTFAGVSAPSGLDIQSRYARPAALEAAWRRRGNRLFRRTSFNPGPPMESRGLFRCWASLGGRVARHAPGFLQRRAAAKLSRVVASYLDEHDETIRSSNRTLRDDLGVEFVSSEWRC